MHAKARRVLVPCAILVLALPAAAQVPFHRGDGELVHPAVRLGPPVGRMDADLTTTEYVWAFRREALLPPAPAPLPAELRAALAAGLLRASRDPDETVRWQSLWALARVGRHDAAVAQQVRARVLEPGWLDRDGTLAEIALVALGLVAHDDPDTLKLLADRASGSELPERQRAFAFHGLALAAQGSGQRRTHVRVLAAVQRALLPPPPAVEVQAAALHALAALRPDAVPGLAAPVLELLGQLWDQDTAPGPFDLRVLVPLAVAAIVAPGDPAAEPWRARFGATVGHQASMKGRASVLGLGRLCRPWQDASSPDVAYGAQLRELATRAPDLHERYFAYLAMADAGGAEHCAFLRSALQGRFLVRGWAALALAAAEARDGDAAADAAAIEALLPRNRHPDTRNAMLAAVRVLRREPMDRDTAFRERYGLALPGTAAGDDRVGELLAVLANVRAPDRALAAMALGHLGEHGHRHWSAALAAAIDYRGGTPVLLDPPNGVLRLP